MNIQDMPIISAEKYAHKKEWAATSKNNDFNAKFLNEFVQSKVNSSTENSTKYFRVKYEDRLFEKDLISLKPTESCTEREENAEM